MSAEPFEIVIQGTLSPALAGAIDGFEVSRTGNGTTHLVGWVPDQARLHSILQFLRDLNIALISVRRLPHDEADSRQRSAGEAGVDG